MIFYQAVALQQVQSLLQCYKELKVVTVEDSQIKLSGNIEINREWNDVRLNKDYSITIIIPIESNQVPYVIDAGNQIDSSYPHRYKDGGLCLEIDTVIKLKFLNGMTLSEWMLNYVETYFFSYEYFKRYGVFPFGERAHGIIGLLDYYGEKLNETDLTKTYYLMRYIATKPYRGHFKCPCGSQKHLRDCHGKYVIAYYNNFDAYEFLKQDLSLIEYTLYKVRKGKE